jgi:hypothetical protein
MNPGTFQGISNPALYRVRSMPTPIEQMITASTTWTAPITGTYLIFAVGAGGSGAARPAGTPGSNQVTCTTGGSAGGLAIKSAFLSAGTRLSITIGAGGAAVTSTSFGNNGGSTIVTGGGVSLNAGGGRGGTTDFFSISGTTVGSAGGTASGGDWNFTGGASGDTSGTTASGGRCEAYSGGGAVAWYGTGYRGGAATCSANFGTFNSDAYAGGAGIGGRGGDASATQTTGSSTIAVSGGGSSSQAGSDVSAVNSGGTTINGATVYGFVTFSAGNAWSAAAPFSVFNLTGNGGNPAGSNPGPGGGTAGNNSNSSSGIFAGGGACSGQNALFGTGLGAGSGASNSTTAKGGDGVVFIVWSPL